MTPEDKEIADIMSALCNWLHDQKVPLNLGAVAMAKLVGTIVGDRAKDEDDLMKGLGAVREVVVTQAARAFLLEKEKSE